MISKRGGFIIQHYDELRDLEAERNAWCAGMLKSNTGEELNRGADTTPDAQLDIVARKFLERQRSAFFYVRICHPSTN